MAVELIMPNVFPALNGRWPTIQQNIMSESSY